MDVQGMEVKMVTVVRAIEGLPEVNVMSPLAASSMNNSGYSRQRRAAVGEDTGRVCTSFSLWIPGWPTIPSSQPDGR